MLPNAGPNKDMSVAASVQSQTYESPRWFAPFLKITQWIVKGGGDM